LSDGKLLTQEAKLNVLSCFDGMSCLQIALDKLGIPVNKYFASEIDKYAMQVTQANYPNTIQIGNVEFVTKEMLNNEIHLLAGGSPCQGFSFAGKQLNFEDPRSKLFFEFVRLKNELKPKYFLLENVRMKKESQDVISKYLGVEPIMINSNLVSAQNRVRYYWSNIPNLTLPEDKNILLKDVLEDENERVGARRGRYLVDGIRQDGKMLTAGKTKQYLEIRSDEKSNCLTTVQKDNIVIVDSLYKNRPERIYENKSPTIRSGRQGLEVRKKSKCVRSGGRGSYDRHEWDSVDKGHTRKLTVLECERLQTVPDNYTNHVSNSQRYKMLGNGWTVDVITHILKGMSKKKEGEEKNISTA
jgi:DNA (cytosine-5)-methyltransferase 3A